MVAKQTSTPDPPELLTTREACAYLRVCKSTLYKLARKAQIRKVRLRRARATRWPKHELDRYLRLCLD